DALDAELQRVEEAFRRSNDEGMAAVGSFELALDATLPADPFSPEYREAQLQLYRRVSRRGAYSTEHERSEFDLPSAIREPFPYSTRSTATVGDQLIAIGYLVHHLGISPPAEIVEFGPGWGNTTCALAQMGFRVTAVDVDPQFVELIRARTA